MENKIPPPIVLLITLALMRVAALYDPFITISFSYSEMLAWSFVAAGCGVIFLGVAQFVRAQTTIDPLSPNKASQLVTNGIFSLTRNPMYLGMTQICIGAAFYMQSGIAALGVIGFVAFIQRYQIVPEERAMHALFGPAFAEYCMRTRRWI